MQRLVTCFIVLWLTHIACAQNSSFNQGGTKATDYFVKIQYENIKGKIIVPVEINSKTYRFILDTGAPNIISWDIFHEMKSSAINRTHIVDANGKRDTISTVVLNKISLGGIDFVNMPALLGDNPHLFDCFKVDGIIGSNLFRNSIIQFSSQDRTITLTDSKKKLNLKRKQSSDLVLNSIQSTPIIKIRLQIVNEKKTASEQLIFDTGDDAFYSLALRHFKAFSAHKIFNIRAEGRGCHVYGFNGKAGDTIEYRLSVPSMKINAAEFKNVRLNTTTNINSRIGSALLDYGIVTLDCKNKKFYFEPFLSTTDLQGQKKEYSVELGFESNKLIIGIVWDSKSKGLVESGDQIITIDGINYETPNPCEFIVGNPPMKGKDRLLLTVKNKKGELKEITVIRE